LDNNKFPILLIGDFNGHIEGLGRQNEDVNGKMIKEILNKHNLILMNLDNKCEGMITWQKAEQKSVIDFALVNVEMYNLIKKLKIDEQGDIFDISDHKLFDIELNIKTNPKKEKKWKWIERKYISTRKEHLINFRNTVERKLELSNPSTTEEMENILKNTAEETLQRTYRKKFTDGDDEIKKEKPWFTENIRREIKARKRINRKCRNETDNEKKRELEEEYHEQKKKVQEIVKEEISKYEKKISEEIRNDKSKKKVWECIKKLQGKEIHREELRLYDNDGKVLTENDEKIQLRKVWKNVYRKSENKIEESWNEQIKNEYQRETNDHKMEIRKDKFEVNEENEIRKEEIKINIDEKTREHFDMVFNISNKIHPMVDTQVTAEDIRKQIKKMKTGKAPGPNGLKAELYKELVKSDKYLTSLADAMNEQLQNDGNIPEDWKKSKTVMKKKKPKPTANDLRPIALTNCDYKIFMGIMKEKIEKHIRESREVRDNQAGFSQGRRIEDNLMILKYCIEETYKKKKSLYIAAIDFSKAFDSLDRKEMIEVLKNYNIDSNIVNQIAKIYRNDWTEIYLREGMTESIDITSGIRQGCTGSALLFKLVTYEIMQELDEKTVGFCNEKFKLTSLFYADDGLLIAPTKEDLIKSLEIMQNKSEKYGLCLNKSKSKILIYNVERETQEEEIEGMQVEDEIKYLGVTITNQRNVFKKHKEGIIFSAQKLSNVTSVVIERSVCRTLIGKTYWKNVAMPAFMHAAGIINFNSSDMEKLQKIENGVWRRILNGRSYTPICFLRGEIGASTMEARLMKNRLKYENYMRLHGGELMREIYEDMKEKRHSWIRECDKYRTRLNIDHDRTVTIKPNEYIDKKCKMFDDRRWKEDVESKSSLVMYRNWKKEIKEEKCYNGSYASRLWLEARSNTLKLGDRKRFTGEETKCSLCGYEEENLKHFLLECPKLSVIRSEIKELQQPYEECLENVIARFLFDDCNVEMKMASLQKLYKKREQLEKERTEL